MSARTTNGRGANALKEELVLTLSESCRAPGEILYDALADLQSHLEWSGSRNPKNFRLLSMEAPEGPATVGTEFVTTGADPAGRFENRSVVTEATRPTVFEFVTEAVLVMKRGGKRPEWTLVHRYEIAPDPQGCRVAYRGRVTRISELPGMMAVFRVPVLKRIGLRISASYARKGFRNLLRMAEDRAGLR